MKEARSVRLSFPCFSLLKVETTKSIDLTIAVDCGCAQSIHSSVHNAIKRLFEYKCDMSVARTDLTLAFFDSLLLFLVRN